MRSTKRIFRDTLKLLRPTLLIICTFLFTTVCVGQIVDGFFLRMEISGSLCLTPTFSPIIVSVYDEKAKEYILSETCLSSYLCIENLEAGNYRVIVRDARTNNRISREMIGTEIIPN